MAAEPARLDGGEKLVDGGRRPRQRFGQAGRLDALLRVVERCLDGRVSGREVRLYLPEPPAERAAEPQRGVAARGVGRRGDEVEDGLGLSQVDAAVEVRAQRELAGTRRTCA